MEITLFMYPALNDYHHCVHDHKLYIWWKYVDEFPNMYHYVSALMAVLMGGNPKTLQCNHNSIICRLCESSSLESPAYVLFACPTLEDTRGRTWSRLIQVMPNALVTSINNLDDKEKSRLIFTCYGGKYIKDWSDIYEKTVKFVFDMYNARFLAYQTQNVFAMEA